ncbi:hypothetical protein [Mucilaginibacter phyllosphaerae]
MKTIHWLIIVTGLLTGGMFLFVAIPYKDFAIGLCYFLVGSVVATSIGFLTIMMLPTNFKRSKHMAILAPWLIVLLVILLLCLWDDMLLMYVIAFPFIFIFSSIGGVIAYHITISKTHRLNNAQS